LREQDIETFLPLVKRKVRHASRTYKEVLRPLFVGYIFAQFCPAQMLRAVTYSHGVLRVLGNQSGPQPLDLSVIASIRERIGDDGCVELTERRIGPGDAVKITEGPFWGWSGVFERELSDVGRVAILIETLQQRCRVHIRREALAPLALS
jgi:transcription antitermination factor NusG